MLLPSASSHTYYPVLKIWFDILKSILAKALLEEYTGLDPRGKTTTVDEMNA